MSKPSEGRVCAVCGETGGMFQDIARANGDDVHLSCGPKYNSATECVRCDEPLIPGALSNMCRKCITDGKRAAWLRNPDDLNAWQDEQVLLCDDCGAKFSDTPMGADALWAHACAK